MAGKPRININFNKIYQSNSSGPFQIIENLGRDERSRLFVKIKFLETGTIKDVRYDIALAGKIRDELFNIDFNKIYQSIYYGPFKIIKYIGRNDDSKRIVRIKFLNTGYEYNTTLRIAELGNVKDYSIKYSDRHLDTNIDPVLYNDYIINILHNRWNSMMRRCYNENDINYSDYGLVGVKVVDRWHNVDNYISDIMLVENFEKFYYNPSKYHLDKDYYQLHLPKSERYYGPGRCIFLSIYDNDNLAILEKHIDDELFGVHQLDKNKFQVSFSVDGKKYNFGIYSNAIAAANVYNYYYNLYSKAELVKLLNNVETMSFEEAQQYLISRQI